MNVRKLRNGKTKVLMMIATLLTCSLLGACSDVGDAPGGTKAGGGEAGYVESQAEDQAGTGSGTKAEDQAQTGADTEAEDQVRTVEGTQAGEEAQDQTEGDARDAGSDSVAKSREASGEGSVSVDGAGAREDADAVTENNEILLVQRWTNYAWGVSDNGMFIDAQGKVYSFNFNGMHPGLGGEEDLSFIERLEIIRDNSEGVKVFSEEFVKQIQELGEDLSADDKFDQEHQMYDAGQDTLYFWQPKTLELLRCESTGDMKYTPQNKSAQKIVKLYENELERLMTEGVENEEEYDEAEYYATPTVYSRADGCMTELEVKDVGEWAGNWILADPEQLEAFAKKSGIAVDSILEQMQENARGNVLYFVQAEGPEEAGSHGRIQAFGIFGKRIDFVFDGQNGQESDQMGTCRVIAVSKNKFQKDLTGVTDLEGNNWKYFETQ